jgi:ABC-2 type transport system permease protein
VTALAPSAARASALFTWVKLRIARNYMGRVSRHVAIQTIVVSTVMLLLLIGGYYLFAFIFRFLQQDANQPFGAPLSKRLVGMAMLAFFSMLIFSNLIITLTTTYISREVEFFMGLPVGHRALFFYKFGESTLYSSWAFAILSLPFFIAIGRAHDPSAGWTFYPVIFALLVPFVLIPSALGAIFALLVARFLPARRMIRLGIGLAALSLLIAIALGRFVGLTQLRAGSQRGQIAQVMSFMGFGDAAWAPSTWLARGMRGALDGNWSEVSFWGGMLLATALMSLQICYWLAGRLYFAGFGSSRNSGTALRRRAEGLYGFFDRLMRPLRPPIRALVVKDLTIFWRDPAQWGQLMVLFGLLVIYVANLGSARELSRIQIDLPVWQSLVSLGNVGAVCFVLSILTTRFFYPMLSLEGKQQWVIGLAPLGRTRLVWVKCGVCWIGSLALTVPLTLFSCAMLGADRFVTLLSLATVAILSMGLNSLAIGLGALMPNFQEDNPSRIANGMGGTLNVILSLIYIGLSVVLEAPFVWDYFGRARPEAGWGGAIFTAAPILWFALQATVIALPLHLGLRHWKRLEF